MPICCRCNGSGRCRGCKCAKAGKPCLDCLPARKGHCCNYDYSSNSTVISSQTQIINSLVILSPSETAVQSCPAGIAVAHANEPPSELEDDAILDDVITDSFFTDDLENDTRVECAPESVPSLPSFEVMFCENTMWQNLTGEEFSKAIDETYNQIVHWLPNLFMVPSGK